MNIPNYCTTNLKFCFGFPLRTGMYVTAAMTAFQGLVLIYMSIPLLQDFSMNCKFVTSAVDNYYLTLVEEHISPNIHILTENTSRERIPDLLSFVSITQALWGLLFIPAICVVLLASILITVTIIRHNGTLIVEYLILQIFLILYLYLGALNGLARGYWVFIFVLFFITFMVYLWAVVYAYWRNVQKRQKAEIFFDNKLRAQVEFNQWKALTA